MAFANFDVPFEIDHRRVLEEVTAAYEFRLLRQRYVDRSQCRLHVVATIGTGGSDTGALASGAGGIEKVVDADGVLLEHEQRVAPVTVKRLSHFKIDAPIPRNGEGWRNELGHGFPLEREQIPDLLSFRVYDFEPADHDSGRQPSRTASESEPAKRGGVSGLCVQAGPTWARIVDVSAGACEESTRLILRGNHAATRGQSVPPSPPPPRRGCLPLTAPTTFRFCVRYSSPYRGDAVPPAIALPASQTFERHAADAGGVTAGRLLRISASYRALVSAFGG